MPSVDVEPLEAAARRLSAAAAQADRCAVRLTRTASATTWHGEAAAAPFLAPGATTATTSCVTNAP